MPQHSIRLAALLVALLLAAACRPVDQPPPNVLWILWDTVRADHLSLYGYEAQTTPYLDRWATGARVFDDCVSPGTITVTSHASLFTGLLGGEHHVGNQRKRLPKSKTTLAELLQKQGYRTFLWSANPHISEHGGFHRGFDVTLHPWSESYLERAREIVVDKTVRDRSSKLPQRLRRSAEKEQQRVQTWDVKASGVLAREALSSWLDGPDERPYMAFLNYMEAHRPLIPPEDLRRKFMSADDVESSYLMDRSWDTIWSYTLGLGELSDDELRIMKGTYDAAIAELDLLLEDLLSHLDAAGHLDNTIIVLTSDHGEHFGEHHLLDHQYSVYEPLVRVPLVVHYPPRFAAGRDDHPVMSFDLFPTLLELTGVQADAGDSRAVSLLSPKRRRARLSEYLAPFETALRSVHKLHPDFDDEPWRDALTAVTYDTYKLIRRSSGREELYDLGEDPLETQDLAAREVDLRSSMSKLLNQQVASLSQQIQQSADLADSDPPISESHRKRLEALGYLASDEPTESPTSDGDTADPQ